MNSLLDESGLIGTYFQSHGFGGATLALLADGRFTAAEHACLGEMSRDQGSWRVEGDTLFLQPEPAADRECHRGVDVRFIPMQWGPWFLLIDEYWMPEFCDEARRKALPQWAPIGIPNYIKNTDQAAKAGRPQPRIVADLLDLSERLNAMVTMLSSRGAAIPARFHEFYEHGPVRATVAAAGEDGTLTLHSDTPGRLRPGMRMALWKPEIIDRKFGIHRGPCVRIEVVIERTGPRDAIAKACYFWYSKRRVEVGDRFTTGEHGFSVAGTGVPRFDELPPPSTCTWVPPSFPVEEVSAGLRQALKAARWPSGRDTAAGIGPDGTEYHAEMRHDAVSLRRIVSIQQVRADTAIAIPPPEPQGIVWKPLLTAQEWIRLESVSEGLRTALAESRSPGGVRSATGIGPDGVRYQARVWNQDLVFLDFTGTSSTRWSQRRASLPEPEGVVWEPL